MKHYTRCSCGSEMMAMEFDDFQLEIAIFSQQPRIEGLAAKWKFIWHFLRTGLPYTDQIILNKEDTKLVRDYLNKLKL